MEPVLAPEMSPELIIRNVPATIGCLTPIFVAPHALTIIGWAVLHLPIVHPPIVLTVIRRTIVNRMLIALLGSHISVLLLRGSIVLLRLILLFFLWGLLVLARSVILRCSVIWPRCSIVLRLRGFLGLRLVVISVL
jgi:hypothetical protein